METKNKDFEAQEHEQEIKNFCTGVAIYYMLQSIGDDLSEINDHYED